MSSRADTASAAPAMPQDSGSLSRNHLVLVGALILICYAPVLWRLSQQWINDEDMGHGIFVPVVAGYIAWQRRDRLAPAAKPNWWGLAIVLYAAAQAAIGILGAELFLPRIAFIMTLAGSVLFLGGMPAMRVLRFPLMLLLFMVPIPAILYTQITFPLQLFASQVAETVLGWIGVPVLREGNVLELANEKLSVVEACSGIRSLLTLTFLSLVYAHFFDDKTWMKPALLISTVPIAIAANAGRVTITGILTEYNPELAKGFFHSVEGWIIFMVALVLLIATHQAIRRVYGVFHAR